MIAYNRVLNPDYADGIDKPRVASDGSPLPNAREVSLRLAPGVHWPDPKYTLMAMQFGQFIGHDFIRTAFGKSKQIIIKYQI
jgi:peroxidase